MVIPLFVGRSKSIKALELAMDSDKTIFLATQRDPKIDEPVVDDLYSVGTIEEGIEILNTATTLAWHHLERIGRAPVVVGIIADVL